MVVNVPGEGWSCDAPAAYAPIGTSVAIISDNFTSGHIRTECIEQNWQIITCSSQSSYSVTHQQACSFDPGPQEASQSEDVFLMGSVYLTSEIMSLGSLLQYACIHLFGAFRCIIRLHSAEKNIR